MKKTAVLSTLLAFTAGALACTSSTNEEISQLELSPCCSSAMELVETMPECCQEGIRIAGQLTGCCEEGLLDTTAESDRPECCIKTRTIMEGFKPCCSKAVITGEAGPCCETMPEALKSRS